MHADLHRKQELLPLTDSLASRIRWRYEDYEAMLRAQVALLLASHDASWRNAYAPRKDERPQ
jgi:hypothetical protein